MSQEVLRFSTIGQVDNGAVMVAFDQALRDIEKDCRDRFDLKTARSLTFKLTMTPVQDGGCLAKVDVQFEINSSIPKQKSMLFPMKATRKGISFQTDAPDNPDQETMFGEEPGNKTQHGGAV